MGKEKKMEGKKDVQRKEKDQEENGTEKKKTKQNRKGIKLKCEKYSKC